MNAPLKVGVVGVGHLGSQHARLYAEIAKPSAGQCQFIGVFDTDRIKVRALTEKHGGGLANYEFKIVWSQLGFGSQPIGQQLRLAMYMTQNGAGWDAYDSGSGVGNNGPFEQIGNNPGDYAAAGQLGATGILGVNVPFGSFPGSNFVTPGFQNPNVNNDYNLVGHGDEIDTIEEYYQLTVPIPEPNSALLVVCGVLGLFALRRR